MVDDTKVPEAEGRIRLRPPKRQQDPLRTPLNEILGSEGAVRVLRVLAEARQPMGRTRVARRALLNASGVRRTLDGLAEAGIVEIIGSGRNRSVRLRQRHPLAGPLRSLFQAEQKSFERIVDAAREALAEEELPVTAVWIESPSVRSPGIVDIGVLAVPSVLETAVASVDRYFQMLEEEQALHFVVHGYTDADRSAPGDQRERLERITLLYGWVPFEWRAEEGGPIATHRQADQVALRVAEAISEMLPTDPSLVDRALEWIDGRLATASEREAHELREWRRILSRLSVPQIQAFLTEESEHADRARQSLPFVGALSRTERAELLKDASR